MNQQIKTSLGVVIILIIIATIGMFIWQVEKNNPEIAQPVAQMQAKKTATTNQSIQTTNETADWQTYQNDKYEFQLNFPDSWKGYTAEDSNNKGVDFGVPELENIFSIGVYTKDQWQKIQSDPETIEKPEVLLIGGIYVYTFEQGTLYKSGNLPEDKKLAEIVKAVQDIKKSFKIIPINVGIADWHTYKNDKYGFEFKYPADKFKIEEDEEKSQVVKNLILFDVHLEPIKKNSSIFGGFALNVYRKNDDVTGKYNIDKYNKAINGSLEQDQSIIKSGSVIWFCEKGMTIDGKKFEDCTAPNSSGNLDQAQFIFGNEAYLSENEFEDIVRSFNYFTK